MTATATKKRENAKAGRATAKPQVKPHAWTDGGDKVLILRRCNSDGTSCDKRMVNGEAVPREPFVWPKSGVVAAEDFNPKAECGGGLHGWPWGMGEGEGSTYNLIDDRWIVFAAVPTVVVGELEGGSKCKASKGEVVYCGDRGGAWEKITDGRHRLIEAMAKSGAPNTASGDSSKAASSGNSSTAAVKGKDGIACVAGLGGQASAGEGGAFTLHYKDNSGRIRAISGYPGEDGIEADRWYRVTDGKLTEVKA